MSAPDAARAAILARVRASLQGTPKPAAPDRRRFPYFAEGLTGTAAKIERFREGLAAVRGESRVVRDEAEAQRVLAAELAARGVHSAFASDHPLAQRVATGGRSSGGVHWLPPDAPRAALLEADAGLTSAQLAIAETGTLVLASQSERGRLASLVPPLHVALVPASAFVAALEDALATLRPDAAGGSHRALTWITGPSRTADIEMTLVVGVHGPAALLVLVIDPDAHTATESAQ